MLVFLIALVALNAISAEAIACSGKALFRVTLTNLWTKSMYPVSYPVGAHYSPFVAAVHAFNESLEAFAQPGVFATPGVSQLARLGQTWRIYGEMHTGVKHDVLENPITPYFSRDKRHASANRFVVPKGNTPEVTNTSTSSTWDFIANGDERNATYLTMASMIAPSPDWFVYLHAPLCNETSGQWYMFSATDSPAYDAGVRTGMTFTDSGVIEDPQLPISPASAPVFSGGPGNGTLITAHIRLIGVKSKSMAEALGVDELRPTKTMGNVILGLFGGFIGVLLLVMIGMCIFSHIDSKDKKQ